ncbi:MAG: PAS domain S-box protein [Candidatus Helarchaeota archaeon]
MGLNFHTFDEKIKEDNEIYKVIFEQSIIGICLIQDGIYKYVNQSFANLFGYSVQEIIGKNTSEFIKLIHPEFREFVLEQARKKMREEKDIITNYSFKGIKKNGQIIWLETHSRLVQLEGRPADLVMITDITQRKMAEQRLKNSEEEFNLILENANDLIAVVNERYKIEYANEGVHFEKFGYLKEDLIGKDAFNFTHRDDIPKLIEDMKKYWNKRIGMSEVRFKHKDGTHSWIEVKAKRFIGRDGKQKILMVGRDVTNRRRTEQKLKESEERYRLISENANDIIAIFSIGLKFEYVNENVIKKILGYTKAELIGKDALKFMHVKDMVNIFNSVSKAWKKGEGRFEARIKKKDGTYVWHEAKWIKIIDIDKKEKFLVIFRDISKQKFTEERLSRQNALLNAINRVFQESITCADDRDVVYACLEVAKDLTNSKMGFIGEIDRNQRLKIIGLSDPNGVLEEEDRNTDLMLETMKKQEILERLLKKRKPIIFSIPNSDQPLFNVPEDHPQINSLLVIPLKQRGKTFGILCLANKDTGYNKNDQRIIESLSFAFVEAMMRARAERELVEHRERLEQMVQESLTELKMSGKQLQKRTIEKKQIGKELFETEKRYIETVNLLPDVVYEYDRNLKITYVNEAGFEKFGYSKEDLKKGIYINQMLPEQELKRSMGNVKKLLKGEIIKPNDYIFQRKDGSEFWGRIHSRPIFKEGEVVGVRGVIVDISEHKKMEEELRNYSQNLEKEIEQRTRELKEAQDKLIKREKMDVVEKFAGGISDKLQDPIAILNNSIFNLRMKLKDKDKNIKNFLNNMQQSINRITDLFNFLPFLSHSKLPLLIKSNLNHIIQEALKECSIPDNILIKTNFEKNLPKINIDPTQIKLASTNIITNAVQAMPNNGELLIETCINGNYIEMKFKDAGIGIPKENIEKIFEPLYGIYAKKFGMGLPIVRDIIAKHNGKIDIESKLGVGTTITIRLPFIKNNGN